MAYENDAYDGFDSVIGEEADEGGFVLLPDGEYPFTVAKMEKERFSGSENIAPCWLAVVTLQVDGGEQGCASVFHRLYMVKKQAWKVKQLFVGVGLVDETVLLPIDGSVLAYPFGESVSIDLAWRKDSSNPAIAILAEDIMTKLRYVPAPLPNSISI